MAGEVSKLFDDFEASIADKKLSAVEVKQLYVDLLALANAVEAGQAGSMENEISTKLESLFDRYIAPIDIPRIPAFIENGFVDPALRGQIRPTVAVLFSKRAVAAPAPTGGGGFTLGK